ncbi:MAG: LamG domain-containing protein [Lentisphaerae bacterium]|nr:LamG domain-containing protein [Lentisphaerota bacterium]
MKNIVKSLLVGTLSAGALAVCAEDKTVFNLNFNEGFESGVYEFSKRGSAALVPAEDGKGKVLAPVAAGKKGPAGVILSGDAAPEFVSEAFTLSFKFKYTGKPLAETPKKSVYAWLYDCRYRGKSAKGGMSINLSASEKATNMNITIGCKDGKTAGGSFRVPTALDGKWHEVVITVAPGKLSFSFDGKVQNRVMLGVPAPASQRLTIGDCVGSSYSPFYGLIDDVKLTVPAAPAAAAPAAK